MTLSYLKYFELKMQKRQDGNVIYHQKGKQFFNQSSEAQVLLNFKMCVTNMYFATDAISVTLGSIMLHAANNFYFISMVIHGPTLESESSINWKQKRSVGNFGL